MGEYHKYGNTELIIDQTEIIRDLVEFSNCLVIELMQYRDCEEEEKYLDQFK